MQISTTTKESSMEIPLKTRERTAIWSSDTVLGIDPREPKTACYRDTCTLMYIASLLTIAKLPYNWWMDQEIVVYIHNGALVSHKE
jgi:hypothetical protein